MQPYRRQERPDTSAAEMYAFGKQQPQAIPLERAVLGALMLDREALEIVGEILTPESFYLSPHQRVYAAIQRLQSKSSPVDMLTVTEELRTSGEFKDDLTPYDVVELTSQVASAANVEYHARIIAQKHILRTIIQKSTNAIRAAYEEQTDPLQLLEGVETDLFNLHMGHSKTPSKPLSAIIPEVMKLAEVASSATGGIVGVPSGLDAIDRETGGFRNADLVIVAARPGVGKSAFVNTVMLNAAERKCPVGVFTLEMSAEQLTQRLMAAKSGVTGSHITNGKMQDADWQQLGHAAELLYSAPIHIDDSATLTLADLRVRARRMVQKQEVGLIIIDYLQLLSIGGKNSWNRQEEMASIARGLKNMAKDLKVPVIALSQLSRAVEVRGGSKRPMLSDLRETGEIEQAADTIGFLYRPEMYQIMEDENGPLPEGHTEFIVAKHRNGRLFTAAIKFIARLTVFTNADRDSDYFKSVAPPTLPITTPAPVDYTIPASARRIKDEDIPF